MIKVGLWLNVGLCLVLRMDLKMGITFMTVKVQAQRSLSDVNLSDLKLSDCMRIILDKDKTESEDNTNHMPISNPNFTLNP